MALPNNSMVSPINSMAPLNNNIASTNNIDKMQEIYDIPNKIQRLNTHRNNANQY